MINNGVAKEPVLKHLTCIIMTQILDKAGINKHIKLSRDALSTSF